MIGIIDYGRGNLRSVEKSLAKVGYEAKILERAAELAEVQGVILPGVGAFADAMYALEQGGWVKPLQDYARTGKPVLGICLGMQVLFEVGEEHGEHQGLGLLPGRVVKFLPGLKIPHMGWNTVDIIGESGLLAGITSGAYFYFVHSYYALPDEKSDLLAVCEYGQRFPAVVGRGNVWGTQFHPEKSGETGLQLLENFGKLVNGNADFSRD